MSASGPSGPLVVFYTDLNKRRTLQSVNCGLDGNSHSSNPFEDTESSRVSRSEIASMSGRW